MQTFVARSTCATRVVALLGLALLSACAGKDAAAPPEAAPPAAMPEPPTREQLATATIGGVLPVAVTLEAGRYQGAPAAPGAASRTTITLLEPTVLYGDLDGAPPAEAAALVAVDTGGSGEVLHLVAFAMRDGKATAVATAPVGDRVKVFRAWFELDKVHMDVVEAGPGEPACCPTQLTRKAFGWQDGKLALREDTPVGSMSINLLAATDWVLVEMDGRSLAQGVLPPTALIQYGKVRGFAGCNRYTASVNESKAGTIALDAPTVDSSKACDAAAVALEAGFLEHLPKVDAYTFHAGRLLLTGAPDGQGVRPVLVFSR
ncbi:MAG: hypothetical protein K0R70_80 [Steroidobacteraceae bacterium]|nr:hypothetical protein [Steroidobacteraceae bacterium]